METTGWFRVCFLWQQETHSSNNRLWVEEEKNGRSNAQGFPAGLHMHLQAKHFQHTHTDMLIYRYTNRCNPVATALAVIHDNSYCVWMFIHQYHVLLNEAETNTGQEILCNDKYLYRSGHLAHNNILCSLCGINHNIGPHSWAVKVLTCIWGPSLHHSYVRSQSTYSILTKQLSEKLLVFFCCCVEESTLKYCVCGWFANYKGLHHHSRRWLAALSPHWKNCSHCTPKSP